MYFTFFFYPTIVIFIVIATEKKFKNLFIFLQVALIRKYELIIYQYIVSYRLIIDLENIITTEWKEEKS